MNRVQARSSLRRSQQGGSAILEAAFVFVPFLALVLGIIDVSVAIFLKNTIQYAVREGVRYAITGQTTGGQCQDASIKSVVQTNAMGFLNGSTNLALISVTYYDPTTLLVQSGVGSNRGGNIVQVSVTGLSWIWMAPLLHANAGSVLLSASSADVLESPPNGVIPCR